MALRLLEDCCRSLRRLPGMSTAGDCSTIAGRAAEMAESVAEGVPDPPPIQPVDGVDWATVKAVIIVEVVDYH